MAIGDCDIALFGGPLVVPGQDDTGSCDLALFGGPLIVTDGSPYVPPSGGGASGSMFLVF